VHNERSIGKSLAVHNIWQVDAKENLCTQDGQVACYLTLSDEKSGAWLSAVAFAYGRICQVPLETIRSSLLDCFRRWGKPGAMRVDNGEPLGCPTLTHTSPLALWLIAIDIDMIFNKPACPQQNGVVERMQGTSARWVEPHKCLNLSHLQARLAEEALVQRAQILVKKYNKQTRIQAFPQLETSRRVYQATDFDAQRVYRFLATKIYTRKVSANGTISFYNQVYSVGTAYKSQFVQIKLDIATQSWDIYNQQGLIKTVFAQHLSPENILNLTVCQRTAKT
jgi:hypothetical protein